MAPSLGATTTETGPWDKPGGEDSDEEEEGEEPGDLGVHGVDDEDGPAIELSDNEMEEDNLYALEINHE
jgi:hypothetical protein